MVNFVWAKEIIKKYPEIDIEISKKGEGYVWVIKSITSNIERVKRLTDELEKTMPKPRKSKTEIKRLIELEEKALKKYPSNDMRYWEIKNRIEAYNNVLNLSGGALIPYA